VSLESPAQPFYHERFKEIRLDRFYLVNIAEPSMTHTRRVHALNRADPRDGNVQRFEKCSIARCTRVRSSGTRAASGIAGMCNVSARGR
jgi:hypothetical protein